ncbi:hypothetical protein Bbelb_177050 [Branchiostoma belcheri]|nr:hypothetical protein Bbelb_177050 [Branchiostoma belcheri]
MDVKWHRRVKERENDRMNEREKEIISDSQRTIEERRTHSTLSQRTATTCNTSVHLDIGRLLSTWTQATRIPPVHLDTLRSATYLCTPTPTTCKLLSTRFCPQDIVIIPDYRFPIDRERSR